MNYAGRCFLLLLSTIRNFDNLCFARKTTVSCWEYKLGNLYVIVPLWALLALVQSSMKPFGQRNETGNLCIELFHQPTLMHSFLYSLTICLLHYYPRHVSSINMPIFRRKNRIHTASGILALCKRLHSTLVESGLVRSQPVYCADVYREPRYQMLCEYNFSSWRWAC